MSTRIRKNKNNDNDITQLIFPEDFTPDNPNYSLDTIFTDFNSDKFFFLGTDFCCNLLPLFFTLMRHVDENLNFQTLNNESTYNRISEKIKKIKDINDDEFKIIYNNMKTVVNIMANVEYTIFYYTIKEEDMQQYNQSNKNNRNTLFGNFHKPQRRRKRKNIIELNKNGDIIDECEDESKDKDEYAPESEDKDEAIRNFILDYKKGNKLEIINEKKQVEKSEDKDNNNGGDDKNDVIFENFGVYAKTRNDFYSTFENIKIKDSGFFPSFKKLIINFCCSFFGLSISINNNQNNTPYIIHGSKYGKTYEDDKKKDKDDNNNNNNVNIENDSLSSSKKRPKFSMLGANASNSLNQIPQGDWFYHVIRFIHIVMNDGKNDLIIGDVCKFKIAQLWSSYKKEEAIKIITRAMQNIETTQLSSIDDIDDNDIDNNNNDDNNDEENNDNDNDNDNNNTTTNNNNNNNNNKKNKRKIRLKERKKKKRKLTKSHINLTNRTLIPRHIRNKKVNHISNNNSNIINKSNRTLISKKIKINNNNNNKKSTKKKIKKPKLKIKQKLLEDWTQTRENIYSILYNEQIIQNNFTSYKEKRLWIKRPENFKDYTDTTLYLLKCCYGILKKIEFSISNIKCDEPLLSKATHIYPDKTVFNENESTKKSFFSSIGIHLSEKYISFVLFSRDKENNKQMTKKKLFANFLCFLLTLEKTSWKLFFELL